MDQLNMYQILFLEIEKLLAEKDRVVVAIDGGAASGKTTLAGMLSERYGGAIVHMDDFFLRPEQRTPERFAEAGGNFDRERFTEEVIPYIRKRKAFSYRIFDCSKMCLFGNAEIADSHLVVVEGSYSHHPAFADAFDLRVFLRVDEEKRKQRIIARNGSMSKMFFIRWIPLENRYFSQTDVKGRCDLCVVISDPK